MRFDVAVADAYGWRADLPDEEILSRLVALNKVRVQEEARGVVQWLRPDYQISLLGTPKEKAELDLVGGAMAAVVKAKGRKPAFPADDIAQTAAVMCVLANTPAAVDAETVAATFKQGRRIVPKISAVLTALARTGFVTASDGGSKFELRRAA